VRASLNRKYDLHCKYVLFLLPGKFSDWDPSVWSHGSWQWGHSELDLQYGVWGRHWTVLYRQQYWTSQLPVYVWYRYNACLTLHKSRLLTNLETHTCSSVVQLSFPCTFICIYWAKSFPESLPFFLLCVISISSLI